MSARGLADARGGAAGAARGGARRAGADRAGRGRLAGAGARAARRSSRSWRSRSRRSSTARSGRRRRPMPQAPEELRSSSRSALERLELWPQLHGQAESVRYSLAVGGKRVRPVICLAVGGGARRAARAGAARGARARAGPHVLARPRRPAGARRRRGAARPSVDVEAVRRGESAVLAGDALLAEAFRLAAAYETTARRARARRGDARDDRRPVPRHDGRATPTSTRCTG